METIKIYLIGGRVVEFSENAYNEFLSEYLNDRIFLWLNMVDINGDVHHIKMDNIVEIVKPKSQKS